MTWFDKVCLAIAVAVWTWMLVRFALWERRGRQLDAAWSELARERRERLDPCLTVLFRLPEPAREALWLELCEWNRRADDHLAKARKHAYSLRLI